MDRSGSLFPGWFQRWGVGAWLVVGMFLVIIGAVWLLDKTSSIVMPLITGFVIAAVAGAIVDLLERRGWPRAAGAAVVILGLVVVMIVTVGLVLGGITSQSAQIDAAMSHALERVQGWAHDIGITSAPDAAQEIKKAVPDIGRTLVKGLAGGISGLTSLLVFLGFTVFTSFFLMKDAPSMGRWIQRHMGAKPAEARIVLDDIIHALRGYFLGLTIVAGLSTAGVVLSALIVGVPLLGTVAVVTFVASYVPIIGAWTSGIFVVALALADNGTTAALAMAVLFFVCNGPLQQIVQPIAYGATLALNPLVVFSLTIAAGTLFGMAGLVLSAPLVSAAVRVRRDLGELRRAEPASGAAPAEAAAAPTDAVGPT
ncbi:MAG: AI-2E family transporter [Solirubrobacteraceae bacterium]